MVVVSKSTIERKYDFLTGVGVREGGKKKSITYAMLFLRDL